MTWEEILEAIKETPTLAVTILENVPNITGGADYMENSNKAYFDAKVGAYTSEIYNKLDNDIFDVTGLRKEANEKSYDFQKRVMADLKKGADDNSKNTPEEIKAFKDKIKDLEEKVQNGASSGHWRKSYEEVVEELRTNKEAHEQTVSELNSKILGTNVSVDVQSGLSSLKFNETLPEAVRKSYISQHEQELIKNAKIIDGKVVYHDAEGKPLRDKQYKPATAEYLLKERLKDILAVDRVPGGGAPQGGKGEVVTVGTGDSATKKLVLDKGSFNTRQEFQTVAEKALADQGITRIDKEFNSLIDEAHKEYGVSELNRN